MSQDTASGSSAADFAEKRFKRRAVEAAFWGMPTVNLWAMREGFKRDLDASPRAVSYFSKPMDWHLQITTPNNTTLYILCFWNTETDGPIVVEVPETTEHVGLFGTVMDAWQRPLVDFGDQGHDRGLGAKYLFLPPGHQEATPEGYIPIDSPTNNGWFLLRTLVPDFTDESLARGTEFIHQFRIYPLAEAANPPPTSFHDGFGLDIDAIAPYDDTFFDALNTMVQEEPVAEQDLVALGMLKTIGIEKGRPFDPTTEQRTLLHDAAQEAQQEFMDLVISTPDPYWPDRNWSQLVVPEVVQATGFSYTYPRMLDYTPRANFYYSAFSSVVNYGTQTNYLVGGRDAAGGRLDGGSSYTLTVPADVPVRQFWSVLVFDLSTAGFLKHTPKAGVSSLDPGLVSNPDGSVDVQFGPDSGNWNEANWAPTLPDHDYFLLFRFYGPTEQMFDRSWKLNDLERHP